MKTHGWNANRAMMLGRATVARSVTMNTSLYTLPPKARIHTLNVTSTIIRVSYQLRKECSSCLQSSFQGAATVLSSTNSFTIIYTDSDTSYN